MYDTIEQDRAKRRDANLARGVAVGDFIQMTTWFGDIWAEVVYVNISSDPTMRRYASVDIVKYDKYGRSRNRFSVYMGDVRSILSASDVEQRRNDVFHSIHGKRGVHSMFATWPTPAGKHTPINPGGRDRGKEWHPDVPAEQRSLNYRPR